MDSFQRARKASLAQLLGVCFAVPSLWNAFFPGHCMAASSSTAGLSSKGYLLRQPYTQVTISNVLNVLMSITL